MTFPVFEESAEEEYQRMQRNTKRNASVDGRDIKESVDVCRVSIGCRRGCCAYPPSQGRVLWRALRMRCNGDDLRTES
jgi:hypothetical protein